MTSDFSTATTDTRIRQENICKYEEKLFPYEFYAIAKLTNTWSLKTFTSFLLFLRMCSIQAWDKTKKDDDMSSINSKEAKNFTK